MSHMFDVIVPNILQPEKGKHECVCAPNKHLTDADTFFW